MIAPAAVGLVTWILKHWWENAFVLYAVFMVGWSTVFLVSPPLGLVPGKSIPRVSCGKSTTRFSSW